jgi:hypothetical protein
MFKLNILGEKDKVIKTYETSKIKYGLIEDMVVLSKELEGKSEFEQFGLMKPLLKNMFVGLTDEELRNVDFLEVLGVIKNLMSVATNGFGVDEKN